MNCEHKKPRDSCHACWAETVFAELKAERDHARVVARTLAYAIDHSTKPTNWVLDAARGWDARGQERKLKAVRR